MVTDEQVLVDDDLYILDKIKSFLSEPDVVSVPAAKTLMNVVDRKVKIPRCYRSSHGTHKFT